MPSLARHCQLVVCAMLCLAGTAASAQQRSSTRSVQKPAAKLELFNPVAFFSQVITAVITGERPLAHDSRFALESHETRAAVTALDSLAIQFAPGREQQTIALVLAESLVRVKLSHDWSLRCELASRDQANADPELQLDLGIQFKF